MMDKQLEDELRQLDKVIQHHENLLHNAKLMGAIGAQTLQELTVKYLNELKALKEAEDEDTG